MNDRRSFLQILCGLPMASMQLFGKESALPAGMCLTDAPMAAADKQGLTDYQLLERIDVQFPITHEHIGIEVGGGFPKFITAHDEAEPEPQRWCSSSLSTEAISGISAFAGDPTSLPTGIFPVFPWTGGFKISKYDARRIRYAAENHLPLPLSFDVLVRQVHDGWRDALDQIVYHGFQGSVGIVNNPSICTTVVCGGTWKSKSREQILGDILFGLSIRSGVDTMLIPESLKNWAIETHTIEWLYGALIERGIRLSILSAADQWIAGQGIDGLDRAVLYRANKDSVYVKVPTAPELAMVLPTGKIDPSLRTRDDDGALVGGFVADGGYQAIYIGCVSSVIFRNPKLDDIIYLDGV